MGKSMPEQLQPVINFVIAAFDASNPMLLVQGVLIALVLGFIMSRMGQIFFYILAALVIDMLIVPVVKLIIANDMNFGGAVDYVKEVMGALMADPMQIASRAVFFLIAIILVRLISSVIRRS
jgi:hypothetical protein